MKEQHGVYFEHDGKTAIRLAGVENYSEEWDKLFCDGKHFIIKYNGIHQIHIDYEGRYSTSHVRVDKGLTKKGRHFMYTATQVNEMLGFNACTEFYKNIYGIN